MVPLNKFLDIEDLRKMCDRSKTRVFGFILYSKKNPYVRKVLKDEDFWSALDDISGPNWLIFSACPKLPVDACINNEFLQYFDIDPIEIPCFVVFIWDGNNQLKRFVVEVEDGPNENAVYESLRNIIETITSTEAKILDEYKWTENVYREVVNNLKSYRFRVRFKKDLEQTKRINEIVSTFVKPFFHI